MKIIRTPLICPNCKKGFQWGRVIEKENPGDKLSVSCPLCDFEFEVILEAKDFASSSH